VTTVRLTSQLTAGLQLLVSAASKQSIAADSWARLPCVRRWLSGESVAERPTQGSII